MFAPVPPCSSDKEMMQLRREAEGPGPPGADTLHSPVVTVHFGGEEDGPDLGLVRVQVPAGGAMPAHRHKGSDVILAPIAGRVRISKGEESIEMHAGDCALVRKEEEVSLSIPGSETAHVIVAADPANFVAGIREGPRQVRPGLLTRPVQILARRADDVLAYFDRPDPATSNWPTEA